MNSNRFKDAYQKLVLKLKERSRLGGIMGLMHWDQEVIMPKGSVEARAKQMAALAGVLHEKSIDPEFGRLIDKLINAGRSEFTKVEWCNISEAKRDFDMDTKVPKELIQELAELSSLGHQVWAKAREDNHFSDFAPTLERLVDLKIKWAGYAHPDMDPYDANLDKYERGMTAERVAPMFDKLKYELINLIRSINDSGKKIDAKFYKQELNIIKDLIRK